MKMPIVKNMTQLKFLVLKNRRILIILFNLFLISVSYLLSYYLRFDFTLPDEYFPLFFKTLPVLLIIKFTVFYSFGVFHGLWRYVSINDLWQIIKANFIASVIFFSTATYFFSGHAYGLPRSIFLNDILLS